MMINCSICLCTFTCAHDPQVHCKIISFKSASGLHEFFYSKNFMQTSWFQSNFAVQNLTQIPKTNGLHALKTLTNFHVLWSKIKNSSAALSLTIDGWEVDCPWEGFLYLQFELIPCTADLIHNQFCSNIFPGNIILSDLRTRIAAWESQLDMLQLGCLRYWILDLV